MLFIKSKKQKAEEEALLKEQQAAERAAYAKQKKMDARASKREEASQLGASGDMVQTLQAIYVEQVDQGEMIEESDEHLEDIQDELEGSGSEQRNERIAGANKEKKDAGMLGKFASGVKGAFGSVGDAFGSVKETLSGKFGLVLLGGALMLMKKFEKELFGPEGALTKLLKWMKEDMMPDIKKLYDDVVIWWDIAWAKVSGFFKWMDKIFTQVGDYINAFDVDGDGKLDPEEMKNLQDDLGKKVRNWILGIVGGALVSLTALGFGIAWFKGKIFRRSAGLPLFGKIPPGGPAGLSATELAAQKAAQQAAAEASALAKAEKKAAELAAKAAAKLAAAEQRAAEALKKLALAEKNAADAAAKAAKTLALAEKNAADAAAKAAKTLALAEKNAADAAAKAAAKAALIEKNAADAAVKAAAKAALAEKNAAEAAVKAAAKAALAEKNAVEAALKAATKAALAEKAAAEALANATAKLALAEKSAADAAVRAAAKLTLAEQKIAELAAKASRLSRVATITTGVPVGEVVKSANLAQGLKLNSAGRVYYPSSGQYVKGFPVMNEAQFAKLKLGSLNTSSIGGTLSKAGVATTTASGASTAVAGTSRITTSAAGNAKAVADWLKKHPKLAKWGPRIPYFGAALSGGIAASIILDPNTTDEQKAMSLGEFIGMTLGAWKMGAIGAMLGGMIGAPGGILALGSAAVGGAIGIGAGIYGGGWAGRKLVAWLMGIETPEQVDDRQTEELAGMDVQIEDLMAQTGAPGQDAGIDSQIAALKSKRNTLSNKRDFNRSSSVTGLIQIGNKYRGGMTSTERADYMEDTGAFDRDFGPAWLNKDEINKKKLATGIKSGTITSLDIQALLDDPTAKLRTKDREHLVKQMGVARGIEAAALDMLNESSKKLNMSLESVIGNSRPHLVTDIGLAMKNGNLGNFANTQISADQNTQTNVNYTDNSMAVYNREIITQSLNSSVLALQS